MEKNIGNSDYVNALMLKSACMVHGDSSDGDQSAGGTGSAITYFFC